MSKRSFDPVSPETNRLATVVVDAAYQVHCELGPGLPELAYEACLAHACGRRGLHVQRQVVVPIVFDGITLDEGFRMDLLINNDLVVELKAVAELQPIHTAQVLTCLKLAKHRLGLLINFNVVNIGDGIKRLVR